MLAEPEKKNQLRQEYVILKTNVQTDWENLMASNKYFFFDKIG